MIRWILPDRLGTGPALSATHPVAQRIDVRNLVDAAGNDVQTVLTLIHHGVQALADGKTVLVVCDFGVSRSNAVAAGILAQWQAIPLDQAVTQVINATGETEIKLDMIDTVRQALRQTAAWDQNGGTILITGAGGFIGRNLVGALDEEAFWAPTRATLDLIEDAPAQIAARLAKAGTSCIVHLAHPRIYTNNAALGQALTMQKSLMDAALSVQARFVLISSAAVFAGHHTGAPFGPQADLAPRGMLGMTKALQEQLLQITIDARGLQGCIVRLAQVYGAGGLRPRFLESFAQAIAKGQPIQPHRFDDGPAQVDLVHIRDVVHGLQAIIHEGRAPIYHLGGSTPQSPGVLAQIMAQLIGRDLHVEDTPVAGLAERITLDWSTTKNTLGWAPQIPVQQGLADFLAGLSLADPSG